MKINVDARDGTVNLLGQITKMLALTIKTSTSTSTSVKKNNVKIKNKKIKLRSTNKFFIFQYND